MQKESYKIIEGQQRTDEWFALRDGLITGSIAKKVKAAGNGYVYETIAKMTTDRPEKDLSGIEHVDRGIRLEDEARIAYEKESGEKVFEVSFIQNGKYGLSPDGLVLKDKLPKKTKKGVIKKVVEIKCPDTNNHIRYIIENKIPAEHKDQIIHAFIVVDDCDEVDFVSYDPKFKLKPLHIINIKRRDLYVDIQTTEISYQKFLQKVDEFYSQIIN